MASNAAETLIGAAVLAVAGAAVFYAAQVSGFEGTGGGRYALHANFNFV